MTCHHHYHHHRHYHHLVAREGAAYSCAKSKTLVFSHQVPYTQLHTHTLSLPALKNPCPVDQLVYSVSGTTVKGSSAVTALEIGVGGKWGRGRTEGKDR